MDTLEEQANTLSRCGSFYYRILTDASKEEAEYMSHLTFCNRTNAQLRQISDAVLGGCYYKDFYRTFRFTDADIDWNGVEEALQRRDTTTNSPIPVRYEQLTIEGAFLGQTDETHVAASSDAKALLFPDADSYVTLPATQELTWDLRIDPNIMVTSIEQPNGDILYANVDFGSTFGKLTFLINPIQLFPNMQLFARSYTGRMPNLYNYMLRLDDVYGPVDRILYHYRHTQTPKSLYYASAQACGLAVVRQDCTIVSAAPLLDGYAYSTTDGVYDAPYPHSKLTEGTELKKDTVIGGDELYVLCGPHDPLPPSVTSISLDNILPVKGLSAPNADIVIYDSDGLYQPMYEGPAKKLEQYQYFLQDVTDVQSIGSASDLNVALRNKIEETGYTVGDSFKLVLKVAELEGGGQRPLLDLIPAQGAKNAYCLNITTGGDKPIIYGLVYKGDGPNLTWVAPDIHTDDYNEWMHDGTTLSSYISRERTLGIDASSEALESFNWGVPVTFTIYYDARTNTSGVIVAGNPIDAQRGENRVVLKNVVLNLNDITNGSGNTSGTGGIKKCTMQLSVQKAATAAIDYPQENAIAHVRTVVCPNRVITACINESYMTRDMYLKLTNFLQRELLVGSVLATANLPVSIQEDAGSIDSITVA